jgi:hypothetical protein
MKRTALLAALVFCVLGSVVTSQAFAFGRHHHHHHHHRR